jgi:hypothetical protein
MPLQRSNISYTKTRWVFQRGLALCYFLAFCIFADQAPGLLGEHGLLPIGDFIRQTNWKESPSLFFLWSTNTSLYVVAGLGLFLSLIAMSGISEKGKGSSSYIVWGLLWFLYLSIVNVGQIFYGFGWETMLLEAGAFAIFLGGNRTSASFIPIFGYRWMVF